MILKRDVNYIVSGIERSGTSLLMQILQAGGVPVGFDHSRPSDTHNPKGYFELEGGKVINKLQEKTFPLPAYEGMFIKITAYGLQFLPQGKYTIIYSERNIEEILDSMERMMGKPDKHRQETKTSFLNLNTFVKNHINKRPDMQVLYVNYNEIIAQPKKHIQRIISFLGMPATNVNAMVQAVDDALYRRRRDNNKS